MPTPSSFQQDAELYAFVQKIGPCRLHEQSNRCPQTPEPYYSLLKAVTGQQLHNAAARRIFGRLCCLGPDQNETSLPPSPQTLLSLEEKTLRQCGLSQAKLLSLKAIAQGRIDGLIPSLEEAQSLSDEILIKRLSSLRGVGRWTVEMLLIFHLQRPDVLPTGDLGVQEGWRRLKILENRPTPRYLKEATTHFSPHRSALAWYCWQAKALLPPVPQPSKKP